MKFLSSAERVNQGAGLWLKHSPVTSENRVVLGSDLVSVHFVCGLEEAELGDRLFNQPHHLLLFPNQFDQILGISIPRFYFSKAITFVLKVNGAHHSGFIKQLSITRLYPWQSEDAMPPDICQTKLEFPCNGPAQDFAALTKVWKGDPFCEAG